MSFDSCHPSSQVVLSQTPMEPDNPLGWQEHQFISICPCVINNKDRILAKFACASDPKF